MKIKSVQGKKSVRVAKETPDKPVSKTFSISDEPLAAGEMAQELPKFDPGQPEPSGAGLPQGTPSASPAFEDLGSLPSSYLSNTLYLVARDPHWLFSYWDVDWSAHAGKISGGQVFLRLRGEEGGEISRLVVNPNANNWYIAAPGQGMSCFAELGYEQDGCWQCVCQSDLAFIPSQEFAGEDQKQAFASVPLHLSFQRLLDSVRDAMQNGESLLQALSRLQAGGLAGLSPKDWSPDQCRVLEALVGRDLVDRINLGSGEVEKILRRDLAASLASEASSGLSAKWALPVETAPTSLGSGFGASWSAQPFGGEERERGFFMHVNAEVIFYGGTDPDATVTIGGREIALNPDGSFRYHFLFPDGEYEIPIVATSPDGVEQRAAVLSFHRGTARQGEVGHTAQPSLGTPMGSK